MSKEERSRPGVDVRKAEMSGCRWLFLWITKDAEKVLLCDAVSEINSLAASSGCRVFQLHAVLWLDVCFCRSPAENYKRFKASVNPFLAFRPSHWVDLLQGAPPFSRCCRLDSPPGGQLLGVGIAPA